MSLLHALVLAAVLQWSLVTGEGCTDQLCRLWEDHCARTVEVAELDEDGSSRLQPFCQDVADMLRERDAKNCESLLFPYEDKQVNNEGRPNLARGQSPQPDLALLVSDGRTNYFHDCADFHTALAMFSAVSSGVHDIKPVGMTSPISVYCDQTTDGGGWTVIQRRFDGFIDFNRPYDDFVYGFGSADGEHWLGLVYMYYLTNQNAYELYIELEDWSDVVKYAKYDSFSLGSYPYHLHVDGFSGTAGDGFYLSFNQTDAGYLNGQAFSARGVDHDSLEGRSCSGDRAGPTGGWWYKACSWSALNGPYLRPSDRGSRSGYGIYWNPFEGIYRGYLKKSKMMVRPSDFQP